MTCMKNGLGIEYMNLVMVSPHLVHKYTCIFQESIKQDVMYNHIVKLESHDSLNMTLLIMDILMKFQSMH